MCIYFSNSIEKSCIFDSLVHHGRTYGNETILIQQKQYTQYINQKKFGESQKHSDRAYFLNLSFIFSICHLSFISQFVISFFLFSQFVISKHSDRAYFLNLSFIFSICHLSFISQFVISFFLFSQFVISQFVIFVISFFLLLFVISFPKFCATNQVDYVAQNAPAS